ncbi:MAG: hypothetical protein U5J62_04880 [Desulfurivibrio sp.]|nr:hypothetical protein [Desulfurivibrio sp.]
MMKLDRMVTTTAIILGLATTALGASQPGAAQRGQALFEDPGAFNGQTACAQCHPGGNGLEEAAGKSSFQIMGQRQESLEEAINFCIVNANQGEAIERQSSSMQELVAYLKTLGGQSSQAPTSGYGAPPPATSGYGR